MSQLSDRDLLDYKETLECWLRDNPAENAAVDRCIAKIMQHSGGTIYDKMRVAEYKELARMHKSADVNLVRRGMKIKVYLTVCAEISRRNL